MTPTADRSLRIGTITRDRYGQLRVWIAVPAIVLGVMALIGALVTVGIVVTTNANYHFAVQGCRHWSEAIGRPSKEVRYTWGTWDCLTPNPAKPGTWIPTSKLFLVNR